MKGLIEANEYLGLPHSVHIHQNNLGNPGNYTTTLDTLKLAEGFKAKNKFGREQVMHSTHLQFHSYGGTNWGDFESKAKEVIDYVNKNKNITIDTGCVTLDETTTMTADGPFEHHLTGLNHLKWANVMWNSRPQPVSSRISTVPTSRSVASSGQSVSNSHSLQRTRCGCFITTDHPNAGPFTRYPRIMKWLMSEKARKEQIDAFKYSDKVVAATNLGGIDREITLYETRPDDPCRAGQVTRACEHLWGLKARNGCGCCRL